MLKGTFYHKEQGNNRLQLRPQLVNDPVLITAVKLKYDPIYSNISVVSLL